jgi:hypothetical protein
MNATRCAEANGVAHVTTTAEKEENKETRLLERDTRLVSTCSQSLFG